MPESRKMTPPRASLDSLTSRITACTRCARLRRYGLEIAQTKRRAYENETYWAKPVAGFGPTSARLWILGLAPGAHGAHRTGRVFTGDSSGLWLYRALYRAGFSNQAESTHPGDGLVLEDAYVSCAVRCAPPDNKPTPDEQALCQPFLTEEYESLKNVRVFLVLGQFALKALWRTLPTSVKPKPTLPKFKHGGEALLLDGRTVLMSYHPSQQNTFTGKLTESAFDAVFSRARRLIY